MKSAFFGTLSHDQIIIPGTEPITVVGGSALYGSLASSLFCPTSILSVLGSDFPKKTIRLIAQKGVDVSLLQKSSKPAFRWSVEYSNDLTRSSTINRSLNSFADFDADQLEGKLDEVKAVYVGKNDPVVQLALFKKVPRSAFQILATRVNWIINKREELEKALKLADIFMLHDEELRLLAGPHLSLPEMIEKVMSFGPKVILLMRDEHGLVMYGKFGTMVVPSYPLAFAVDPTGAGDAFGGALAGVLGCLGKLTVENMRKALILASIVSSYVVEDYGVSALENLTLKQVFNRAQLYLSQLPSSNDIVDEKAVFL